jgi:hypothetical protein
MTALPTHPTLTRSTTSTGVQLARAGVVLTAVGAIPEAVILAFANTTDGTDDYKYAADYWLSASAIPHAIGLVLVLLGVRRLQQERDGRCGLAGLLVAGLGLFAVNVVIVASLVEGHDVEGGGTYVVGTLATVVGLALFAAGSWRTGLLPRWMLASWPIVWAIGSYAAFSFSPVVLLLFYAVLLMVLRRREES